MTATTITILIIFIVGLFVGSFMSTVIHRTHETQESFVRGRSKCPKCRTQLKAQDLIPVFSYIFTKGRCRHCKERISAHYPLLEILTAGIFATLLFKYDVGIDTLFYMLIGIFLLAIFFEDILYREILNGFVIPLAIFSLGVNLVTGNVGIVSMLIAVVIALLFFGGQILMSRGRWLGGGDLKLGIAMAILLGWEMFILAVIVGYILGAFSALYLVIRKKARRGTQIAFCPYLVIGTFAALIFGEELLSLYQSLIISFI
ncbi:MAG: prepilin peptidase [Patescibacteria group bacterium]|nr:prepilin peptidase [Patescibacteria group bacterium]